MTTGDDLRFRFLNRNHSSDRLVLILSVECFDVRLEAMMVIFFIGVLNHYDEKYFSETKFAR